MKNRTIFFIIVLILTPFLAPCQENTPLSPSVAAEKEPEAKEEIPNKTSETDPKKDIEETPSSIYDLSLADDNVELFWDGYWKFNLAYGTGFAVDEDGTTTWPSAFPGINTDFFFEQVPDFTVSLWLFKRYYLEATFLEGFDKNSYATGYRGMPGEFVQKIRLGTSDIGVDPYRGIVIPTPKYNTPGITAKFETSRSSHEIMVRYDPTKEKEKFYLGQYEADKETISLAGYTNGRYFVLPDTGITDPTVYRQKTSGAYTGSDGRRYEKLSLGDYTVSGETGLLTLASSSSGAVLVYYSGLGSVGGGVDAIADCNSFGQPDPNSPIKFEWTETDPYDGAVRDFSDSSGVTIEGNQALLIYLPGRFSPFERCNVYPVSGYLPTEEWRIYISVVNKKDLTKASEIPKLFQSDRESKTLTIFKEGGDNSSLTNRYPFADQVPSIYGLGKITDSSKIPAELSIITKNGSGGYTLNNDVVPGSVQIKINGVLNKTATIDYKTGIISFSRYIFPDDEINITYRVESTDMEDGSLYVFQGNKIQFSPEWDGEIAASFLWNFDSDLVTQEVDEAPGELLITTGVGYEGDRLQAEFTSDFSLTTPNTAGYFRLKGMEENYIGLAVYADYTKPSVVDPYSTFGGTYKELIYRDYTSTTSTSETIVNSYTWSGANIDTSEEGASFAQPTSSDPFTETAVILEYDLAAGEYSAGDLILSTDGPINISGYSSISFYTKIISGNPELTVIIGENGEKNDWNSDGSVDPIDSGLIVTKGIYPTAATGVTTSAATNGWTKVTITLTDSDKQKLTRCRSLRFVTRHTLGGTGSGILAIGQFILAGSGFFSGIYDASENPSSTGEVAVVEVNDSSLPSKFDEVNTLFHPEGETQRIAHFSWSGVSSGSDHWKGETYLTPFKMLDYKTGILYVKTPETSGTYEIEITDSSNKGIHIEFTPGTTADDWEKLTIDLETKEAKFSGDNQITKCTIEQTIENLSVFTVSGSNTVAGDLYIDEIYFKDPLFSIGNRSEFSLNYFYNEVFWQTADGIPLASKFSADTNLVLTSSKVLSEADLGSTTFESDANTGIDIFLMRWKISFHGLWDENTSNTGGGHSVRFPADWKYGWIEDQYSRTYKSADEESALSRSNILHFNLPKIGFMELFQNTVGNDSLIDQRWGWSTQWNIAKSVSLTGGQTFSERSGWDNSSEENYFADWFFDYSYWAPLTDDITSRDSSNYIGSLYRHKFFEVNFKPTLGYSRYLYTTLQTNKYTETFSVPVFFYKNSRKFLTLTHYYSRNLEQKVSSNATTFGEDYNHMSSIFTEQFPLINFAPIVELFSEDTFSQFKATAAPLSSSSYTPTGKLTLSRQINNNWWDLIVPSAVSSEFARDYFKTDDTNYYITRWDFTVTQSTLNLFGKFGTHPIFPFYNSETITNSLKFSLEEQNQPTPSPEELIWQCFLLFEGKRNNTLTLDNRLSFLFDEVKVIDEARVSFIWRTETKNTFEPPFTEKIKIDNFLLNEEKLILSGQGLTSDDVEFADPSYNAFYFTLRHETKFVFLGVGSLGVWVTVGSGYLDQQTKAGAEVGLELILKF